MHQNRIKHILILSLVAIFITIFTTSKTYAFWADAIVGSTQTSTRVIQIGEWTTGDNTPQGINAFDLNAAYSTDQIVWYDNNIYIYKGSYTTGVYPSNTSNWIILNDTNWYATVTYKTGDLVYHNGAVYEAQWQNINYEPTEQDVNGPWQNMVQNNVAWVAGQASYLGDIVYHNGQLWIYHGYYTTTEPGTTNAWGLVGNLTFSLNFVYANGDITLYNGVYYITNNGGWATGSTPGTNAAWTVLNTPLWTSKWKNGTTHVIYNNHLYQTVAGSSYASQKAATPGTSQAFGVWDQLDTQEYQQYDTYVNGDLVMYNGTVYELANALNSTLIPGTAANSWNGMGNIIYSPYSTYLNDEYAIYTGLVYQVVNATNANVSTPGTSANAWNLLNGYTWYWFNTYQAGEVVLHNNVVYVALQTTTNLEPGLAGSSSYWAINS